eukprot:9803211-Alexandrium_andersonii.AAC.1
MIAHATEACTRANAWITAAWDVRYAVRLAGGILLRLWNTPYSGNGPERTRWLRAEIVTKSMFRIETQ